MIDKRKIQEINAGSMADISFLLLIFFIVATTMVTDRGVNRVLPAWQEKEEIQDVKQRNVLQVQINQYDQVLIESEIVELPVIRIKVKEFISNRTGAEGSPEIEIKDIDLIGEFPVSKGVVSLQNERRTTYGMYVRVQNELQEAFNEAREELAMQKFDGKRLAELTEEEMKAITDAIPLKVSEAEPRNIERR